MPTPEQMRAYRKKWEERNPEMVAAKNARYVERVKVRYREDAAFREKMKATTRARYKAKSEEINERKRVHNITEDEKERRKTYNRTIERRRRVRDKVMRDKYGITIDDYEAMLASQGGNCAICGGQHTPEDRWKSGLKNLRVDHDHTTGRVRGLLCFHCNTGLGHFRDSPELLSEALAYLSRSE